MQGNSSDPLPCGSAAGLVLLEYHIHFNLTSYIYLYSDSLPRGFMALLDEDACDKEMRSGKIIEEN